MKPHHEHEFEAAPGLPEALPAGEHILWQGSPDWKRLAVDAFHVKRLSIYFASMLLLQVVLSWDASASLLFNLGALTISGSLALIALALLALTAKLSATTTLYTITNKRIVMRIGIVLTLSFNLPLRWIQSAQVKPHDNGYGDIALDLKGEDRIAYLHLWPHARPWEITKPQPMLRNIADIENVGKVLYQAWLQRQQEIESSPVARETRIPVRMPTTALAQ
jgi:hypothetical protein